MDRATLIDATLRMIDADGIGAVTMRRLAAELGVSPMAAYRHVGSKDELLRVAAAEVVRRIEVEPTGWWQDDVVTFFGVFHDELLGHPGVAGLFAGPAFLGEVVYEVSEPILAAMLGAGLTPPEAVSLFMACASASIGAAVLESAQPQQGDGSPEQPEPDRYPSIAAIFEHLPNLRPAQRHEEALRGLVLGYALMVAQRG